MRSAIRLLFLLLTLFTGLSSQAQIRPFSFGVYGEGLFAADSITETMGNGFGGGLDFQFRLPVKFTFTASAGFLHFSENKRTATDSVPELNAVMLRAGIRYRIKLFYIKLESGATFPLKHEKTTAILSPGIGIKFSALDLQVKYEAWMDDRSFYGAKLAIFF